VSESGPPAASVSISSVVRHGKKYGVFLKVFPLLFFSLSVLVVRPFAHYVQLITPWSYLGWAAMTAGLQFNKTGNNRISLIQRVFIVLAICAFARSASRIISYPFDDLALRSKNQEVLAESVNNILKKGDSVVVINYPEIYVLCDFYSPIHNYRFNPQKKIFGENPQVELCKIDNFLVFNNEMLSPVPDDDKFEQLSFKKTDTVKIRDRAINYKIYKRVLPCI